MNDIGLARRYGLTAFDPYRPKAKDGIDGEGRRHLSPQELLVEARLARLEERVAQCEARLAKLEPRPKVKPWHIEGISKSSWYRKRGGSTQSQESVEGKADEDKG